MPDLNFLDLQLRDLHLLQVMLSEGSLTRAASLLDTTQPTLSKALARLRLHLGDPLLVRDGQIMRPTPKGAEMLTPLRNLLSGAKGLVHPGSLPFDPQLLGLTPPCARWADQATDRYLPISSDEALAKIGAALRAVNRFANFWTPIPRLRPNDTQSTW